MFNYVVKDPDSSRLSGEFWIKDSVGKAKPCVLELDALLVLGVIRQGGTYSLSMRLANRSRLFSANFLILFYVCRACQHLSFAFLSTRKGSACRASKQLARRERLGSTELRVAQYCGQCETRSGNRLLNCSGLGLEQVRHFCPEPRSNTWTALHLPHTLPTIAGRGAKLTDASWCRFTILTHLAVTCKTCLLTRFRPDCAHCDFLRVPADLVICNSASPVKKLRSRWKLQRT